MDRGTESGIGREQPSGFVALANGAAGSVDEGSLGAAVGELATHAPTVLVRTESADDVDDALRSLDGRRPIVIGGDGSLHLVVNRLIALDVAGTPVGLVPLGTGNDLARGAGLSLDPVEAARTAATGVPTPIAVGIADDGDDRGGEVIVNNAHLGMGARAAQRASGLKRYLGPLAYPAGALVAGLRPEPIPVEIAIDDGDVYTGSVTALVVALGPSAGGGHELAPNADPTDPQLEVVAFEDGSLRDRLAIAADVLRHRDVGRREAVQAWTGARVRVRTTRGDSRRSWDVDGEAREWSDDVTIAIGATRWHLVTPG